MEEVTWKERHSVPIVVMKATQNIVRNVVSKGTKRIIIADGVGHT